MEIMTVLIGRAKVDKGYADVVAGIFEGTHPSYKALNPGFILKSLLQGGVHVGANAAMGVLKGPEHWNKKRKDMGNLTKTILKSIKENPASQLKWLGSIARNTLDVGAHVVKNAITSKN